MKHIRTLVILAALALCLTVGCGEGTRKGGFTILMYHDFTQEAQSPNNWTLPIDRFRADLQWLTDHGYTFYLPSEIVSGKPLADKAVLLSFDDGYLSNYTLAFPLLKEYQAKAVLSVVAGLVDKQTWNIVTWEMCREMADSGLVEIGSHTYNCHNEEPPGVLRLPGESEENYRARVLPDLLRSAETIETQIGRPVCFLAYPNGKADPWCADFVRERFGMSVTTWPSAVRPGQELYNLGRYNMAPSVTPGRVLR